MTRHTKKWIFWDNDGVLVDTEGLYFQASREALSRIGIDLTRDLFERISIKGNFSSAYRILDNISGIIDEVIG